MSDLVTSCGDDTVDATLAQGVAFVPVGAEWMLRRPDRSFDRVRGALAASLSTPAALGSATHLAPTLASAGLLAPRPWRAPDTGVLAGALATRLPASWSAEVRAFDGPPKSRTGAAMVVWAEGRHVHVSPLRLGPASVRLPDVQRRRVAASSVPSGLRAYLHARRRSPLHLDDRSAALVAEVCEDQWRRRGDASRRLCVIDLDRGTWSAHHVLPVPSCEARRDRAHPDRDRPTTPATDEATA